MTAILPGLARETVEIVVCGGVPPAPPLFDDGLERPAPCFVTITAGDGELRGCVGTVEPATPRLPLEVQRNALAAALDDPRMLPVSVHELPYLHYKVDVLGEMEPVTALDQIDPARWGLLLRHPMTSALLLPAIDGIDTPEQQLAALLRKAAMRRWDEHVRLWRFTVTRHDEDDQPGAGPPSGSATSPADADQAESVECDQPCRGQAGDHHAGGDHGHDRDASSRWRRRGSSAAGVGNDG